MDKIVSIIIPCYNQGKYVQDALNSAINQTYKNIEIICISDGSSDNSDEIIKKFVLNNKNIKYINCDKNMGVANARNTAIDSSAGEYILPLDADDVIESTYVEKAVAILDNDSNIGIVYSKARKFGKVNEFWDLAKFNINNFLFDNCIFNCALFRKNDFIHAGKYKENIKSGCEDWDLWLSIIALGLKPYQIPEVLFNYRQEENYRTKLAYKDKTWRKEIIKNNLELFLNNDIFIEKIFEVNYNEFKKYKQQRNFNFIICIIEFVIILIGIFWIIIK